MPFACSICEEESLRICVRCTKDTCSNHLCEKCGCCSDCCDCDVPLDDHEPMHAPMIHAEARPDLEPEPAPGPTIHAWAPIPDPETIGEPVIHAAEPKPDPEPEPPHPSPDPDPFPGDEPDQEPGPVVG